MTAIADGAGVDVTDFGVDSPEALDFLARVWTDTAGFCTTVFAALGDRLGFFRALAGTESTTVLELAAATGTEPRYVEEWAAGMLAAGYLQRPAPGRLALFPHRRPVLVDEAGPVFAGGVHQMLLGLVAIYPRLVSCMVEGGGVAQHEYGADVWEGLERFSASATDHLLVDVWLRAIEPLHEMLVAGCRVLDVGTGHGRAVRRMAAAYPASEFVGLDLFPEVVNEARRAAAAEQLDSRASFVVGDIAQTRLGEFDVVTTFDVVHEADDPKAFAAGVRDHLRPGGLWLAVEATCEPEPEANAGPLGTMLYGYSLLFCLTTSLARGGVGLGTCGLPPATFAALCRDAGLEVAEDLLPTHPYHRLTLVRRPPTGPRAVGPR